MPSDTMNTTSSVAVIRLGEQFRLFSARAVAPDEQLFTIEGDLTSIPTRYSVQVGPSTHVDLAPDVPLEVVLDRFYWRFMNHSCEPNVTVRGRAVHGLRRIEQWEEITFDYNTTEFDIAEPFDCRCGSARCAGRVSGFRHLARSEQERLRPHLAAHLLSTLDDDAAAGGRRNSERVL